MTLFKSFFNLTNGMRQFESHDIINEVVESNKAHSFQPPTNHEFLVQKGL